MESADTGTGPNLLPEAINPPGTEIVFDTASGISLEEQREILAGLDSLAGKDRIELSPGALKTPAKKRGALFPVLINGGGLLILAAGLFLLYAFRDEGELRVREGRAGMGTTERRLIQEIRRETAGQISAKEREIAGMTAMLAEVDEEFQNLQEAAERMLGDRERELREIMEREIAAERERLTAQNLSEAAIAERMRAFDAERIARLNGELASYRQDLEAERRNSEQNLQRLQEEYRSSLAGLQNERAQILEAARIREANQRAQMEERIGELDRRVEQGRADLSAAREELSRLSGEQERANLVEGQLAGYYAAVQSRIAAGELAEAGETLAAMRAFIDTPSFRNVRALQTRRDLHLAAIAAFRGLIDETLRRRETASAPPPAADSGAAEALRAQVAALQAQNAALEEANRDQQRLITQGSVQGQALAEMQAAVTGLRQENAATAQALAERDEALADLRGRNESLQNQNAALQTQAAAQTQQAAERASAIARLEQENSGKDQQITTLNQQLETIRAALQALSQ